MIPIKLELTNFLSYRSTAALDLTGVSLACIAGQNGAGKSTILDGITWVLFGKSRAKSDDDVVNRIAARQKQAAEVRFSFALENVSYRVIRRKKPGRSASLELQLMDSSGGWQPLTESKVRETQEAVETLLKMNYDTFVNASFLLQGKADEFTTKTPNRRKQILSDLLGVSEWERFRERAVMRRKEVEAEVRLLDARLQDIDTELGDRDAREAALKEADAEAAALRAQLSEKEELLKQARRTQIMIEQQRKQLATIEDNVTRVAKRIADLTEREETGRSERAQFAALLAESEAITAAYSRWQEADKTFQTWQQLAAEHGQLLRKQHPHELAVETARTRLQQQIHAQEDEAGRVTQMRGERLTLLQQQEASTAALTKLETTLRTVREQEQAWHEARAALQALNASRAEIKRTLTRLQNEARRITGLEKEREAVIENKAAAIKTVAALLAERNELEKLRERHALTQADIGNLDSAQQLLRDEMETLRERIDRLKADGGDSCPLCGQVLTAEHRQTVLADLQQQGEQRRDQYLANKERSTTLRAEVDRMTGILKGTPRLERNIETQRTRQAQAEAQLVEIERAIAGWQAEGAVQLAAAEAALADRSALETAEQVVKSLEKEIAGKQELEAEAQALQRQSADLQARLKQIDEAVTAWETSGHSRLAELAGRLANEEFATEAREALALLDKQIADLGYDATAHDEARHAREALREIPERYRALLDAERETQLLDQTQAEIVVQKEREQEALSEWETQRETVIAAVAELENDALDDLNAVENEVLAMREARIAADQQVGVMRSRVEVLAQREADQIKTVAERETQRLLINRLKLLEQAFGRDGVQALLIEHALPEIESKANALLERLTDGGMRVTFETQKQLKSRDAKAETLEIRIVDSAGERPYENYSGGEQFRVNFAIRLALSQVLAQRAGARLQTLVIDEGFGSQDPIGRQRLVEAINTIRDDFRCILVVTHIEELKDAFPTRIEVVKEPAGSTVAIVG